MLHVAMHEGNLRRFRVGYLRQALYLGQHEGHVVCVACCAMHARRAGEAPHAPRLWLVREEAHAHLPATAQEAARHLADVAHEHLVCDDGMHLSQRVPRRGLPRLLEGLHVALGDVAELALQNEVSAEEVGADGPDRRQDAHGLVLRSGHQNRDLVPLSLRDELPGLPWDDVPVDDRVPAQISARSAKTEILLRERELQGCQDVLDKGHDQHRAAQGFRDPVHVPQLTGPDAAQAACDIGPPEAAGLLEHEGSAVLVGCPRENVGHGRDHHATREAIFRARGHQVVEDVAVAFALAHQCDLVGVTSKGCDVVVHPVQQHLLVGEAQVVHKASGVVRCVDPAEDAQAEVKVDVYHRHFGGLDDQVTMSQVFAT
mmetsp:Transcript_69912/g.211511  ORF Transcript_69912/g.211511 Transcript_69912/m.211511 type:complete len:372 (-) Transcript_69912:615-1730(-)